MNIELIREFVVLADELSFSTAANKMFISRSALSKHMQALEAELDVELLSRNNQTVLLTEAGKDFAQSARSILQSYDAAVRHVRVIATECARAIRVGYLFRSASEPLAHACEEFRKQHECRIVLRAMEVHAIYQGVAKDDLDLGITMAFPDLLNQDYACIRLMPDEYGIVVPKDHPLACKKIVEANDLEGLIIHGPNSEYLPDHERVLAEYMQSHASEATVISDIFDIGSLHPIMSMGAEALFAPRHVGNSITDELVFIPLSDFNHESSLCLIWKKVNEREDIVNLAKCISRNFEAVHQ